MSLIESSLFKFPSVLSLTIQINWTKKSQQLGKIQHSINFGKWITVPQILSKNDRISRGGVGGGGRGET